MITLKPLRRHMRPFRDRKYLENAMAKRFGRESNHFQQIMKACDDARAAHRGEGRRKNDESKLVHEREMIGIADFYGISEASIYVAIFLHDLVEDYGHKGWTLILVEDKYGRRVRSIVNAVTKVPQAKGMSVREASRRTFEKVEKGGWRAVVVKCIDRTHNLLTPWPGGKNRLMMKIDQTLEFLVPLAVKYHIPTYPIISAVTMLQRRYGLHNSPESRH